jgi:hypothetical protein
LAPLSLRQHFEDIAAGADRRKPILQGDGLLQLVYAVAHERRTLMIKQLYVTLGLVSLAATGACAGEVKVREPVVTEKVEVAQPAVVEKVVAAQPPVVERVVVAQPPVVEKVVVAQPPVVVEQVKLAKPKVELVEQVKVVKPKVEVVVKRPVVKETLVVH